MTAVDVARDRNRVQALEVYDDTTRRMKRKKGGAKPAGDEVRHHAASSLGFFLSIVDHMLLRPATCLHAFRHRCGPAQQVRGNLSTLPPCHLTVVWALTGMDLFDTSADYGSAGSRRFNLVGGAA